MAVPGKMGGGYPRAFVTRKIKFLSLRARLLQLSALHMSGWLLSAVETLLHVVGSLVATGLVFMFKMPVGCSPLVTMKSVPDTEDWGQVA